MSQEQRSYASLIDRYNTLVSGFKANEGDFAGYKDDITTFDQLLGGAIKKNDAQEKAKAALHQISEEMNVMMKELKQLTSRLESAVYAKYGKKNDKLEEFGLKAWRSGGRKGPRTKQG